MAFESVLVCNPNGTEYGPATLEDVKRWAQSSQISDKCWLKDMATGETRPIGAFPEVAGAFPMDIASALIPRNGRAVIAYYLGIFSWLGLPLLLLPGIIMGGAAVYFGFAALSDARKNPLLRGKIHAIVGIVSGLIVFLLSSAILLAILIAYLDRK